MSQRIVDRRQLELPEDPRLLSPPRVDAPLYQCGTVVTVLDFAPYAEIEVEVAGTLLPPVNGGSPWPQGVPVAVPALVAGQKVRARQRTPAAQSDWSVFVTVEDHTKDFPAGPPRPQINPAPVYKCGVRTGVGNLLIGGNVWITADGSEVGRVNGCQKQQGVNVTPAYGGPGQKVRAWFELCGDPSPPSIQHETQPPPAPLPAPVIPPRYETATVLTIDNIVNGAKVTVYRAGVNQGTWPCWGGSLVISGLSPFAPSENFTATQGMCPGDPESDPGSMTVLPCSALPPPVVGPVQAGDDRIILLVFDPSATIKVWRNGQPVGASGGPVVILSKKVASGDTLHVVQDLQGCPGQQAVEIKVPCIDPPVAGNPALRDLFPVGSFDYASGDAKGSVYYPAADDGANQPFNQRLAATGRAPVVFMAHGNHSPADPSYLGYDYFQATLAKTGIVAVSIDCNALNGGGLSVQNIEDRADLIIENIAKFQGFDGDPTSPFFQHLDFGRVGLMGHSRGGDAVVLVPTVIGLPGVTIKAALSLAPTNARSRVGLSTIAPKGHAYMTILPAGDGDVRDNNGAQFYDQATPSPFKSQLYVHYTNHNFFNRQWVDDDSLNYPQPAVIARAEHERILAAYGCALYRAALLGHGTNSYLLGSLKPAGVMAQHVYLSYQQARATTVDNHEDGNTISANSLGAPTSQLAGMSADEFPFGQRPGAFNGSFYGESTGMVCRSGAPGRIFRSELREPTDVSRSEIWIRAAEVTDGFGVPPNATGFQLGLEDVNGVQAWVDSDEVGGLPRPYARNPGMIKTMLNTLRFKAACFGSVRRLDRRRIVAILIRCDRNDERAYALDDLQIVSGRA